MTPDALIAEMRRVLHATREERDAARLLERIERRLASGSAWEEADADAPFLAALLECVDGAYPEGAERDRLAFALELAILEERTGDAGVLCVVGEPPRGWNAWSNSALSFQDPWDGTARYEHRIGYLAVRRGWGAPEVVSTRYSFGGSSLSALYVPETTRFFVAAGELLTVFDVETRTLVLERDLMLAGPMQRVDDRVLLRDECDLIAFTLAGREVWSEFTDPPYTTRVDAGIIEIVEELTGATRRVRLSDGRPP